MMHTEPAVVEGEDTEIGRDPRQMTVAEFNALGHVKRPLLDAIRQNCIECCGGNSAEVRRCRAFTCPMWPYRMRTNPFRAEFSEEKREAMASRLSPYRRGSASAETANSLEVTDE